MKRVYQVSFTVEQNKIEDIFLALGKALASHSALKSGFSIDYVETVEDNDQRYSDESVATVSRTVGPVDNYPYGDDPDYGDEEPTRRYTRIVAPSGKKKIKDYIIDYIFTVGSATSEEAGVYLVNESARYQEVPFKASSASPSLSGLAKIGLLVKPKLKSGRWKTVQGIDIQTAREILKNSPPLVRKKMKNVEVL